MCKYDPVQLSCSKSFERILILSSFFSPAATAPIYCPLSHDYHDKEHAQDVSAFQDINQCTETPVTTSFLSACHGQKRCNLSADPAELQASVCSDHFVYLKTVFACVDMRAIEDKYVDRSHKQITKKPAHIMKTTFKPITFFNGTPDRIDEKLGATLLKINNTFDFMFGKLAIAITLYIYI